MNRLSLTQMAIELLQINESFGFHVKNPYKHKVESFKFFMFEQMWGSTSGAFEGVGGCAMINQRTYVFYPEYSDIDYAVVFFGGRFGYLADLTDKFKEDLENECLCGVQTRKSKGLYKYGEGEDNEPR